MPCNDWGSSNSRDCDGTCNLSDLKRVRERNDQLARLLCGYIRVNTEVYIDRVPGLKIWWKAHQEQDRKREEEDRKKKVYQRHQDEKVLESLAKKLGKKIV